MLVQSLKCSICVFALLFVFPVLAVGVSSDKVSSEVSDLFLSLKIVLAKAQPLINDPKIGDKGLTADVVIERAKVNYQEITGQEFQISTDSELAVLQENLLLATRNVIDEAQPLINMEGVGFKGFITAIFARQLAKEFSKLSPNVEFKFTAPKRVLRSAENMPDDWETMVFESKFESNGWPMGKEYSEQQTNQFRWMKPLYHEQGCMSCHGGPKGERDIVGYKKEGASIGDLAGAFSVTLTER